MKVVGEVELPRANIAKMEGDCLYLRAVRHEILDLEGKLEMLEAVAGYIEKEIIGYLPEEFMGGTIALQIKLGEKDCQVFFEDGEGSNMVVTEEKVLEGVLVLKERSPSNASALRTGGLSDER